jgi:hypothetical protein
LPSLNEGQTLHTGPKLAFMSPVIAALGPLLLLAAVGAASAATLPLHFRYLERKLPAPGPRDAVRALLEGLPSELCRLAPADMAGLPALFMDEVRWGCAQRRVHLAPGPTAGHSHSSLHVQLANASQ